MQPANLSIAIFGRFVGGLFAGAVLGLIVEAFFLDGPPEDRRLLLIGPTIGGLLFAIIAVWFGEFEVRGWFKIVSISLLAGVAVGGFGGAIVYPAIMVAINEIDPVFREKVHAYHANVGSLFGIPLGAALGILIGFAIGWWKRNTNAQSDTIPAGVG